MRGRKVEHFTTLWAELPDRLKARYAEDEELFEDYMRQSKDLDELMESDVTRQAFLGNNRKNVAVASRTGRRHRSRPFGAGVRTDLFLWFAKNE